jgi:hypothetical protein
MNTRTLRIAAATSLAGIGLALISFGAGATPCGPHDERNVWGTVHSCIAWDGSIPGGVSGMGTGTGKYLSVELINGSSAVGYGLNFFGQKISTCTATDTSMDGTSVYDYDGCNRATGTRIQVY